ncbi:MAG TPA: hypothetical protein VFP50_10580 [Anaeromyxobacteraceae bacterium]|nr:hypothetical protein [Anaeromyxobacteraceae bacterium]
MSPTRDFEDDETSGPIDVLEALDPGVTWVRFIEAGRELATCPMPGVPRIGDFVNLTLVAPMQLHRVVAVVWQHPGQVSEDRREQGQYLLSLKLHDLPPVIVHVESGTKK